MLAEVFLKKITLPSAPNVLREEGRRTYLSGRKNILRFVLICVCDISGTNVKLFLKKERRRT